MNLTHTLTIGTVAIKFHCPSLYWAELITKEYGPYLRQARSSVQVHIEEMAGNTDAKELAVVRKKEEWKISREDFLSSTSADFKDTALAIQRNKYSLNSWLRVFMTMHGLKGSGLLVHGAGFSAKSGIYLFPGVSGSGKSTLIRKLGKKNALSDELVYLSAATGAVTGASTPFWGELRRGSGTTFRGPVRGIFFLRHGPEIALHKKNTSDALQHLLKTVLFFSGDKRSLDTLLALSARVVKSVPAYDLEFSLETTRSELLEAVERETNGHR